MEKIRFDIYTQLWELIEWVGEPDSFDERVSRLKEASEKIPAFKLFITELYNPTMTFKDVVSYGSLEKKYNNFTDSYNYGVLTQRFLLEELETYADSSEIKTRIKHAHLIQSIDEMNPRDVAIIKSFMVGELVLERINKLVVKEALGIELGEAQTPSA